MGKIKLNKKQLKKIHLKYLEKLNSKKNKSKKQNKQIIVQNSTKKLPNRFKILLKIRFIFRKIFELIVFVICTEVYNSEMSKDYKQ